VIERLHAEFVKALDSADVAVELAEVEDFQSQTCARTIGAAFT